ncbi:GNAT family N-acetyltransferase [Kribbella sp. NPDC051770]|uniref:GNAT family N-acetyltransferase n=1 Tax=Kribbella sp. NPDC051770 TaxID=3155413 RepID=UPI003438FFDA
MPAYRRRGIGSSLMDAAEALVAERSAVVGLGVGLYADYGTAQRMYVRRGYVPDGRGVIYDHRQVPPGELVRLDDDAVLMFTKTLR